MCRYCKNLKRLKDLDEKEYQRIIQRWRLRDLRARNIIKKLVQLQILSLNAQRCLLDEADEFVRCKCI